MMNPVETYFRDVTGTARRIAAILLLQKDLNRNYAATKSAPFPWRPDLP
jgi:hypothetical protein